jgi:hypothetical protein
VDFKHNHAASSSSVQAKLAAVTLTLPALSALVPVKDAMVIMLAG